MDCVLVSLSLIIFQTENLVFYQKLKNQKLKNEIQNQKPRTQNQKLKTKPYQKMNLKISFIGFRKVFQKPIGKPKSNSTTLTTTTTTVSTKNEESVVKSPFVHKKSNKKIMLAKSGKNCLMQMKTPKNFNMKFINKLRENCNKKKLSDGTLVKRGEGVLRHLSKRDSADLKERKELLAMIKMKRKANPSSSISATTSTVRYSTLSSKFQLPIGSWGFFANNRLDRRNRFALHYVRNKKDVGGDLSKEHFELMFFKVCSVELRFEC